MPTSPQATTEHITCNHGGGLNLGGRDGGGGGGGGGVLILNVM